MAFDHDHLSIKIFADGADLESIIRHCQNPRISGFTTNPTLMRKAGVSDFEAFAREALKLIGDKPLSLEVFSDDFEEMERQAKQIAGWGRNIFVKVPITNTKGESSLPLIKRLSHASVRLNVTAMTTYEQVSAVAPVLDYGWGGIVSVFAGRIADTGVDPVPVMKKCVRLLRNFPKVELLWASPRELYNLIQAQDIGCHIITVTDDILKKLSWIGKDLEQVSLETVQMFHDDARACGFKIKTRSPAAID